MKDTIKLHEICGYLPYAVKLYHIGYKGKNILDLSIPKGLYLNTLNSINMLSVIKECPFLFMLLRPLSDLTKEIEHNGKRFVPIVKLLQEYCFDTNEMTEQEINEYAESMIEIDMSYMVSQMLMEWHFDIHGLINRNLALNLNDYEI